jgi:chaperonin GroEL
VHDFGFDADAGEYGDLMKAGIIDPAKVVRSSLENGSSVARLLLSSACLIAEKPGKNKGAGGPGMDDMEGMGGMGGMGRWAMGGMGGMGMAWAAWERHGYGS